MPTLDQIPYTPTAHPYVAALVDVVDGERRLVDDGIQVLAEALRDLVRVVDGDVDPRAAVSWMGRKLGQPVVVSTPALHQAIRFAVGRQWLEWGGGLIRPGRQANQTNLLKPTATAAIDTKTAAPTAATASAPATRSVQLDPIVAGTAPPQLAAGAILTGEQRWRLLDLAGAGGMGRVWRAEAVDAPATQVAIKTIAAPTPANRAALERELKLLRTLRRRALVGQYFAFAFRIRAAAASGAQRRQ